MCMMKSSVRAFGTILTTLLALVLAAPAGAQASPPARTEQAAVTVPDVVGEYFDVAFYALQGAGLNTSFEEYKDKVCRYEEYTVVKQNPVAGSVVEAGTYVTIYFSVWPQNCP
jgi:beta-lactam-binding protein with PASTA domain